MMTSNFSNNIKQMVFEMDSHIKIVQDWLTKIKMRVQYKIMLQLERIIELLENFTFFVRLKRLFNFRLSKFFVRIDC